VIAADSGPHRNATARAISSGSTRRPSAALPVSEETSRSRGSSYGQSRPWHVVEIIQRMTCFLKDRWVDTHPASMYRSKTKALELYTNDSTREEFRRLYNVIKDVITLPEYIQSQYSQGTLVPAKSFAGLRSVNLKQVEKRAGTDYPTKHRVDMAALLPMASAFRELLVHKGSKYGWRVDPHKSFQGCADQLHRALVNRSQEVKIVSHLGGDMEYWGACAQIAMRAMIDQRNG